MSKPTEKEKNMATRKAIPKRRQVRIDFTDEVPITKQSFKDSCDINLIAKKFKETGEQPLINPNHASYGVQPSLDFFEVQIAVAQAKTWFEELSDENQAFYETPEGYINAMAEDDETPESDSEDSTNTTVQVEVSETVTANTEGQKTAET